jgi:hypothetical protein
MKIFVLIPWREIDDLKIPVTLPPKVSYFHTGKTACFVVNIEKWNKDKNTEH